VRAFRARIRGEEEPATVAGAVERNANGASAWVQMRQLVVTIEEQKATIRSLQRELRSVRRTLLQQEQRFGWLDGENEVLRARFASAPNSTDHPPLGR